MKRPSATIGIATVHRNGLIQSPMGLNNNHNNSMIRQPPNKMAKLESDDGNKGFEENQFLEKILEILRKFWGLDGLSSTSNGGSTINLQQKLLSSSQESLQQALQKNPELAFNLQSFASLYSIDPVLMAQAASNLSAGFPSLQKLAPTDLQRLVNNQSSSTFPQGLLLASQQLAASLAASQTLTTTTTTSKSHQNNLPQQQQNIPFKNRRWCNMHAVIAHEIAKHQANTTTKKSSTSLCVGRAPSTNSTLTTTPTIGIAGPGTGSLTSGNSDAAAAAQLQQQANLLNALQQQQQNALNSNSLAASLLAQFSSGGGGGYSNINNNNSFNNSNNSGLSTLAAAAAIAAPVLAPPSLPPQQQQPQPPPALPTNNSSLN
uniref:Uncharacterized protein n=1 Tax=Meloidogyne javanica TaxID=6303 RepID=A0A915LTS4_MELJA